LTTVGINRRHEKLQHAAPAETAATLATNETDVGEGLTNLRNIFFKKKVWCVQIGSYHQLLSLSLYISLSNIKETVRKWITQSHKKTIKQKQKKKSDGFFLFSFGAGGNSFVLSKVEMDQVSGTNDSKKKKNRCEDEVDTFLSFISASSDKAVQAEMVKETRTKDSAVRCHTIAVRMDDVHPSSRRGRQQWWWRLSRHCETDVRSAVAFQMQLGGLCVAAALGTADAEQCHRS
jgi:hypothetical protein